MLCVENLHLSIDGKNILSGVNLTISEGEVVALSGPSGCGKTSLVRCILGLQQAQQGEISNNGVVLSFGTNTVVPAERRRFGAVFQDHLLIPYYNVVDNILLGLSRKEKKALTHEVDDMLSMLSIKHLKNANVQGISGGEQQRVALARALMVKPKVLILDEPFSNLDAALKERLMGDMKLILNEKKIKTLLVTHDKDEANFLAHRHSVMLNGQVS